ncbi:MAG: glycosyltransferase family 4 protein, partial [Chloroflexota bacterium]
MKIALITSMKYGLTQFIFRDTKALADKGHLVRLFTLRNNPGLYNPLPEWEVVPAAMGKMVIDQFAFFFQKPGLYLQLLKTALTTKSIASFLIAVSFAKHMDDIDVIYSYFGDHKLFVGYYLKRITQTPLLVTIRAYELYNNPNNKMFIKALAYCDRVVTITEYNKAYLNEHFEVPNENMDIVRQIIDLEAYKNVPKIKILIVGFFSTKKGHDILFKAIKQLNREDIEVWVVGDQAPDRILVDCKQIVKELGVEDQVVFFGAHGGNALRAFYRECDIFCLPSRTDQYGDKEGFPNVIAEAMAFGKPIVSTKHAGIPEAIDQILCDENNVEQLAEALDKVCNSVELR